MKKVHAFLQQRSFRAAAATAAVLGAGFANAADADGGVVAMFTAAIPTTAGVCAASLAVYGGIKVFKFVRSAM